MKAADYVSLLRLDKPIGILLLLWPTLVALWLANPSGPNLELLIIFVLGTLIMRSAGCVINDYFDRDFDAKVSRTKNRSLVIKTISPKNALIIFIMLMLCAALLLLRLNFLTAVLAFIAALLAFIYPFMKRVIDIPQLVLGMAFAMAVPMAFAASEKSVINHQVFTLYIATVIWALIYDTQYAMVDREDDLKIAIKSSAILFAAYDRAIIALLQFIMVVILLSLGQYKNYFSITLVGFLFVYQQFLIKDRNAQNCFKAFKNNNWVGMIWFLGVLFNF